ncbi:ABC transporter substrate-binding protein, partial [Streptomyces sp. SR27]|nr:ABC transporter substrate-binding protein [Streptomyces sp. SR27]
MRTPAALRLARSSLSAHRRRFLGTFAAVLLGVAFLTGTLVMGDTLRASFDSLFTGATRGTDAVVRSAVTVTAPGEAQGARGPVDAALA